VTIREAATLLGVHPNTVRNRVRDVVYQAEKVVTERGPTWMIDRDSLTANTPTSDSQQLVGKLSQETLTILAREIVREAGLARDPEQEAAEKRQQEFIEGGREHWKAQVDFFKHMAVVSGASLIAVTAMVKAFGRGAADALIFTSAALFLGSAVVSLLFLYWASWNLVRFCWGPVSAEDVRKRSWIILPMPNPTSLFSWPRTISYGLFGAGLIALVAYLGQAIAH